MIAEFQLNGERTRLNHHYNQTQFAVRRCDYCLPGKQHNARPAFVAGSHAGLLTGWAAIGDTTLPKVISFEQDGVPTFPTDVSGDDHAAVVAAFLVGLLPRKVHLGGDCYEAWKSDHEAHPGMVIRFEKYIQDQDRCWTPHRSGNVTPASSS